MKYAKTTKKFKRASPEILHITVARIHGETRSVLPEEGTPAELGVQQVGEPLYRKAAVTTGIPRFLIWKRTLGFGKRTKTECIRVHNNAREINPIFIVEAKRLLLARHPDSVFKFMSKTARTRNRNTGSANGGIFR